MRRQDLSRRDWMRFIGTGVAAGVTIQMADGFLGTDSTVKADFVQKTSAKKGEYIDGHSAAPCRRVAGEVIRPERAIPNLHETDVLVVGGGPAGCCAAIAAARGGAKVTLVERYGYFGGLATGGLVLIILGHWTLNQRGEKEQVVQGIGEEMMQRLEKLPHGIVDRQIGRNPTIDAEVYKYLLVEMITESKIDVFLHSWALDAIMDDERTVCGAVIQTKMGPQAILAKQVIDTTGDGDLFASAGASFDQRLYHIGLPHRLGNLDRVTPPAGTKPPRFLGDKTPIPGACWVNMSGPDADGLDVKTLSQLELNHRKQIWKQVQEIRNTPGYEEVYLMETAPQLGVRITRVLEGVATLTMEGAKTGRQFDDCVGVGGAWNGDHRGWQLPYGALLPVKIDNLLTAGRSISGEPLMSELLRVIPNCWMSGHAAGCAAAVAVKNGTTARDVNLDEVRAMLRGQNAFLDVPK